MSSSIIGMLPRATIPENLQAGHQESAFCFSAAATKVKSSPHP
jgi:hypothetical protein